VYPSTGIDDFDQISKNRVGNSLSYYVLLIPQALKGLNIFSILFIAGFSLMHFGLKLPIDRQILLILMWGNICFIILHLTKNTCWSLTLDRSFPEFYQNGIELALAVIFFLYYKKSKQPLFLWALSCFLYIFIDDFLRIHEKLSVWLATRFEISSLTSWIGVSESRDIWEIIFFGLICLAGVILFFLASKKSDLSSRKLGIVIFRYLIIFVIFAGILDFIHNFKVLATFYNFLGFIEDAGEMVVLSLIFFVALTRYPSYGLEKK
jgi:hypothetical protein